MERKRSRRQDEVNRKKLLDRTEALLSDPDAAPFCVLPKHYFERPVTKREFVVRTLLSIEPWSGGVRG